MGQRFVMQGGNKTQISQIPLDEFLQKFDEGKHPRDASGKFTVGEQFSAGDKVKDRYGKEHEVHSQNGTSVYVRDQQHPIHSSKLFNQKSHSFDHKGYKFTVNKDYTVTVRNSDNTVSQHVSLANALGQRGFSLRQLKDAGVDPWAGEKK